MFKLNDQHRQIGMFNSIYNLPERQLKQLEESWAGTFHREYFCRIDESPFAKVFSNEPSRPNYPVNVLVGLDTLKAGFGWSDEELYENFCFNLQVRYAVGCCDMQEGYFDLRTLYYHRQRVSQHMQKTGENLYEQAFEQATDEQTKVFQLKTGKLRMDSTQIASNIREMSRLQLLVEVLQRVHRMLSEEDQGRYSDEFEPYLKGSSGQYVYRIKGQDVADHLQPIGKLMYRLVEELRENYEQEPTYRMLVRVFHEHFTLDEEDDLRPRKGKELSAGSLQSPDDWEATYRCKRNKDHRGYVANLAETCDPDNEFQLINKVQVESNTTEDAAMLVQVLPDLKERTDVEQIHTDGGYGSPEVDEAMWKAKVEQIQTAIRGRKAAEEKLGLEDFDWEIGKKANLKGSSVLRDKGLSCSQEERSIVIWPTSMAKFVKDAPLSINAQPSPTSASLGAFCDSPKEM